MSSCDKKRFPDKISADFALLNLRRKRILLDQAIRQFPVRAYECDRCGSWHITSQPERGVDNALGPKGKTWEAKKQERLDRRNKKKE